jgi:hypothetical protein
MPPAFQRREQHERVGRAVALIFVVVPGWLPWLCRNRHAGLLDELFGCLVQADHGPVWIMRPLIGLQHILHVGYKASVGLGRDDPLLLKVGLERVF